MSNEREASATVQEAPVADTSRSLGQPDHSSASQSDHFQQCLVALLNKLLTDQPAGAVVPKIGADLPSEAVMMHLLHLARDSALLEADVAHQGAQVAAIVGVDDRHGLIVEFDIGFTPVAG